MLDRIKACLPSLAPAEQRVAKLVLSDPRAFANLPISALAERSHVSKPTVVRFCRSLGYDGLSDFKLKLAGSVSEGVPFIHRSVDSDDKVSDVVVKVIDNTVSAFLKYRNDASTFAISKAVDALLLACQTGKRIEFIGVGNSGIVAQDAQHKFFRLGVNTIAYSDGHMQVMSASLLGAGDCLVVSSNSGRSRDLKSSQHLVGIHRLKQHVGGPAHFERGQGREERIHLDAVRTECPGHGRDQGAHDAPFMSAYRSSCRSRAISAATASCREHSMNSMKSPGASWPASGRSAVIT